MDLTPSQISGATFRSVRKGYDPDEVDAFLAEAAKALEAAQQQATAMEARARAAVARLQEATAARPVAEPAQPVEVGVPSAEEGVRVSRDEAETISRTLLLAQRTADSTIAEARAEAVRLTAEAQAEADTTLDSTREMSARLLADARAEARKVSEEERDAAANEVEALRARREFLIGDVDQLEQFLIDQRDRLRGTARQIEEMCERVPSGLGSVRPPALSADVDEPSANGDGEAVAPAEPHVDDGGDQTAELLVPPEASGPFAGIEELASAIAEEGDDVLAAPDPTDPGPNVDPADVPHLPTRNPASD